MGTQSGKAALAFCVVAVLFVSGTFARQVNVSTVADLTSATLNAKAGDTIWVAAGKYELPTSNCKNDTFVNSTGRDCGLLWMGASGTATNPVVLAGADPANPPEIYSSDYMHNYGIHVTGDYVVLKNLKLHTFSVAVTFDNSTGSLMEDCEAYGTGQEIIHVRDSSQQVTLNRNLIHRSGYNVPRYGEGIYVGTYHKGWASSQQADKNAGFWGADALKGDAKHRYTGYDWRVDRVKITCNVVKATTAENIDVKEGTMYGIVQGNMLVGDWTNTQPENPNDALRGPYDSDDSNIDMKGTNWIVADNFMYNTRKVGLPFYNPHFRYFVEEVVMRGDNVKKYEDAKGYLVTADAYAQAGWCDNSTGDKNVCLESDNTVVDKIQEVRNDCEELFKIPGKPITYSGVDLEALDSNRVESIPVFAPDAGTAQGHTRYEAEAAQLSGCYGPLDHADASGGKYVVAESGNITFTVSVPLDGYYEILFRYNNTAATDKFQEIYLNGSSDRAAKLLFPITLEGNKGRSAAAFETLAAVLPLKSGTNTILVKKQNGYVDLDYIDVPVPAERSSSSTQPNSSNSAAVGNSPVAEATFRVQVSGNLVQITGATAGQPFAVLDMQGRVLRSGRIPATSSLSVYVDRPGVYLVKIGTSVRTVKIER